MSGTSSKTAILSGLRKAHAIRETQKASAPENETPVAKTAAKAFDFGTLPAFEHMRLQRAAADMLKINPPFFRSIEAVSESHVMIEGKDCINFASYDYLGLNKSPELIEAVCEGVKTWGGSVSASRLVGGERPFHGALERNLADCYGVEDAVVFVSGHATNVTGISTLTGPGDLVLIDSLIHNSVAEGVRLSGASHLTFPHNDYAWIGRKLSQSRDEYGQVLIVIEGLYSMDGDVPDLAKFVEVKTRHNAWLMVDEAHSFGVMGKTGRGISEAQNIDPTSVEIWMGTLSKALCSCGGFIAGSTELVEYLRYKAAGFIYSVGLPASQSLAANAALKLMLAEPDRVDTLRENGALFLEQAKLSGLDTGPSLGFAVTPIIVGDSLKTVFIADKLLERGINAMPIIFPAVPEKMARLRFFLTASHSKQDIQYAVETTKELVDVAAGTNLLEGLRSKS